MHLPEQLHWPYSVPQYNKFIIAHAEKQSCQLLSIVSMFIPRSVQNENSQQQEYFMKAGDPREFAPRKMEFFC